MLLNKENLLFKLFLIFFLQVCYGFISAQSYASIRSKYDYKNENDTTALGDIKRYIAKAKHEKDYDHLTQGYFDAGFYNSNEKIKLKYADSAIITAELSHNIDKKTTAYMMRGSLFYFYRRDLKKALEDYIKAFNIFKKQQHSNLFRTHSISYHIGVVKSYLGYNTEALEHFKEGIAFFEPMARNKKLDANSLYDNRKGYYNSMHQAVVCYLNMENHQKADSLIAIGLFETGQFREFSLEHSYFLKSQSISNYNKKSFSEAINGFNKALPNIIKNKDIVWESISYMYLGKAHIDLHQQDRGILYLKKVDSIFNKTNFVIPELRKNYELLIRHAKQNNDKEQELYFINQLLKIDQILSKDFNELSSKIHKDYDTAKLLEEKARLENENNWILIAGVILTLVLCLLIYFHYKKVRHIQKTYSALEEKLKTNPSIVPVQTLEVLPSPNPIPDKKIYNEILQKLETFENELGFTEKGLTLKKLSEKLETNSKYLSQVINENKNNSFSKYIAELRINYITQQMYNDKKILNLTVESLAEKCGIPSRQNFSDLFLEINGIRPTDFIKERKKENTKL
ncbi:helix-turn-helix transcriptional regulator [Riemerella anatipestifer]|uniref:helix-turn-helix domain-containing protein n=1 Tax=Riemerella anatipestifer TaxID=34085 RepID=UPI0012AE9698|nr:AraC family transcriptional regulator [Riemerella anatipestifer]USL94879.1 helix-turn-helix transcriptional regulator [Riemerella anatipestifer]